MEKRGHLSGGGPVVACGMPGFLKLVKNAGMRDSKARLRTRNTPVSFRSTAGRWAGEAGRVFLPPEKHPGPTSSSSPQRRSPGPARPALLLGSPRRQVCPRGSSSPRPPTSARPRPPHAHDFLSQGQPPAGTWLARKLQRPLSSLLSPGKTSPCQGLRIPCLARPRVHFLATPTIPTIPTTPTEHPPPNWAPGLHPGALPLTAPPPSGSLETVNSSVTPKCVPLARSPFKLQTCTRHSLFGFFTWMST